MKQSLVMAARILARGRDRAFISRVAWLDLDRLVSSVFQEVSVCSEETSELGNLYLTRNTDYPPLNKTHFTPLNITNQIQIQAGWRKLDMSHSITENEETRSEYLAEGGATLWYGQDAAGGVMVFLAPYESKAKRMNEKNIILARYGCASSVSVSAVRQHFRAYFRYCSITSVHGNPGIAGYAYLLWLKYGDIRYASQMRASVFRYFNPLVGVLGIVASLYAGNRLFG